MTLTSRLIAYLLLPLLFFLCSYLLFYWLGEGLVAPLPLQIASIVIALLVGSLPVVLFNSLIHSQVRPGFALLKNGDIVTQGEITIDMILASRITAWKLYQQHLDTEVCLQGEGELVYVKMGMNFQIAPNKRGKQFIKHYKHNVSVFEAWVQRALYLASQQDRELLHMLTERTLLNEEDEKVLSSKFLSALEAQPLESIILPMNTDALTIVRKTRSRPNPNAPIKGKGELPGDAPLHLNQELLQQLGLNEPG